MNGAEPTLKCMKRFSVFSLQVFRQEKLETSCVTQKYRIQSSEMQERDRGAQESSGDSASAQTGESVHPSVR